MRGGLLPDCACSRWLELTDDLASNQEWCEGWKLLQVCVALGHPCHVAAHVGCTADAGRRRHHR